MRRFVLLLALLIPALGSAGEAFPRAGSLDPAVAFWTRAFGEVPTTAGLLHDPENLAVVYERVDLPADRRAANRVLEARKAHYAAALRALAAHPDAPGSATQRRLRALWAGAGPVTLRAAAGRIRFQRGQSDRFHAGLRRSGRWEAFIRQTFAARGLPLELASLPHVESSFNPVAGSHVGARGLWQFMPETGARFMRVDHLVDERLDPYRATEAAAALLEENYAYVGTWPLAITAYNHGRFGVQRAVRTMGTDDIARIIAGYRGPYFGFASRNFYPSFLAVLDLVEVADADKEPAEGLISVALPAYVGAATLSAGLGVSVAELRRHNPAVKDEIWNGSKYLPKGYRVHLPAELASAAGEAKLMEVALRHGASAQRPDLTHRVGRGDTLGAIARRYGTTTAKLMAANGIRDPRRLRVGAVLRLPGKPAPEPVAPALRMAALSAKDPAPAEKKGKEAAPVKVIEPSSRVLAASIVPGLGELDLNDAADEKAGTPAQLARAGEAQLAVTADGRIQVQPGETLALIAQWAEVSVPALRSHARLSAKAGVHAGQGLRVPLTRASADTVEARRRAYHTHAREAFLARHSIAGTRTHRVRAGESLWALCANTYGVPLWLALAYNPALDPSGIRPGTEVRFPRLKPRA
jgi:membrane-bound lytic murein transglycosylase D